MKTHSKFKLDKVDYKLPPEPCSKAARHLTSSASHLLGELLHDHDPVLRTDL